MPAAGGARVEVSDRPQVGAAIATAAECGPYYIQHLVAAAARLGEPVNADRIPLLLDSAITDPHDPWDLRHYRDRLRNYYGEDAPAIAGLLDIYAHAPEPLGVDAVLQLLHSEGSPGARARSVGVLHRTPGAGSLPAQAR